MAVSPALLKGFQILRIGERSTKDKKFATDEYLAAPPGTIVAPRPKGQAPTMQNAIKALQQVASKALPQPKSTTFNAVTALKGAQEGVYTIVGGDTLGAIALQMAPHLPIWGPGGSLELLLQANPQYAANPGSIFPGQTVTNPWYTAPAVAPPVPAAAAPVAPAPVAQPVQPSAGDVAGGSEFQTNLINQIVNDIVGRLQIPQMNINTMAGLGFIAPELVNITDPEVFRTGLQNLDLSRRPAAGSQYIPTQEATGAFGSAGIVRELLAPTSELSLSSTNAPGGTIPTLASRFTGARRILSALGGPATGGRVASVGTL